MTFTVVALALAGCARHAPETASAPSAEAWRPASAEELADGLATQHERALAAVDTMAARLKGALMEALDRGGPAEAIAVCRSVAPAVATDVGQEYGLTIGRTSFALRNPDNTPPSWAVALVAVRQAEPAFVVGPNGELGALLPIRMGSQCQMCHGSAEHLSDETRARLRRTYPDDQATGFAAGDLRGWFWAVVPAQAPSEG
jgi:hypothetical protein